MIMTLLCLLIFLAGVGFLQGSRLLGRPWQRGLLLWLSGLALLLAMSSLPFSAPAWAIPVSGPAALATSSPLSDQTSFRFEEELHISATGDRCTGLCIIQEPTSLRSDRDLLQAIQSRLPEAEGLVIEVDNGAVMLSGSVADEAMARSIIKQVEAVPGVFWITVELALTNHSSTTG
jgi:hypothetical protein